MRFMIALTCLFGMASVNAGDEPKPLVDRPLGLIEHEKAIRLTDGDWIVFRYHGMSDSGVQVARMDAKMTNQRWLVECKPLGVDHFKYYHSATVEVTNKNITVTSVGSAGEFVEVLDAETGKLVNREKKLKN